MTVESSSDKWTVDKLARAFRFQLKRDQWKAEAFGSVWSETRAGGRTDRCVCVGLCRCALTGVSRWIWPFAGLFSLALGALFFWWQLQTWTSSHLDCHVKPVHLSSCTKSFIAPYATAKCWTWMLCHTDGNSRDDRTIIIKPMPLHFITYKWTPSVALASFKVYVLCAFVLGLNLYH